MKESLRAGVSLVNRVQVDRDRTIGFMGEEGRVYGTPYLVRDIEMTCRQLILDHGDAGEDSVGTDVSIKHLAPTLLGMTADHRHRERRRAQVTRVVRPRTISTRLQRTHGRFVVDVGKTVEPKGHVSRRRQSEIIAAGSPGKPNKNSRATALARYPIDLSQLRPPTFQGRW
jgi:predicted thioesterase